MKQRGKQAERMSNGAKMNPILRFTQEGLPTEVLKDFAGVSGRVQHAVKAAPRSVTLSSALEQVQRFARAASKSK